MIGQKSIAFYFFKNIWPILMPPFFSHLRYGWDSETLYFDFNPFCPYTARAADHILGFGSTSILKEDACYFPSIYKNLFHRGFMDRYTGHSCGNYFPFQTGGRFSIKALIPSRASSVVDNLVMISLFRTNL